MIYLRSGAALSVYERSSTSQSLERANMKVTIIFAAVLARYALAIPTPDDDALALSARDGDMPDPPPMCTKDAGVSFNDSTGRTF